MALLLAACGSLDRAGLQNKIKADTNGYVGTAAVKAVRCNLDHSVTGASYKCVVVPSNGRKGIPVFVAVHGSKYTIVRTVSSSAGK